MGLRDAVMQANHRAIVPTTGPQVSAPIWLISETHPPSDGRLLRFAEALLDAGYKVTAFGFDHHERAAPSGGIPTGLQMVLAPAPNASVRRLATLAGASVVSRLIGRHNDRDFFRTPERRTLLNAVIRHLQADKPGLVLAKHWTALPFAFELQEHWPIAGIIYDITEVTHAEYDTSRVWSLTVSRQARAIERRGFARAAALTCVGQSVADAVTTEHGSDLSPKIIRNLPHYARAPDRVSVEPLSVLYHGLAFPNRNLEPLIDSVASWNHGRELNLRLTGKPSYIDALQHRARATAAANRIHFLPPVAPRDVPSSAMPHDIGLCPFITDSVQMHAAEPNKLFQYVMGGLAVVTSPLENLERIVRELRCGTSGMMSTPAEIAATLNALTLNDVNAYRRGARRAAETMHWGAEGQRLVALAAQLWPLPD